MLKGYYRNAWTIHKCLHYLFISTIKKTIRLHQAPERVNDSFQNKLVLLEHIERDELYVLKADRDGCKVGETAIA